EGLVYVTDYNNHRVQKFTHDGKYLSKFGSEGSGPGQLKSPAGIAVDNAGLVYVSEQSNHRVSIFTSDRVFVRSFGEKGANEDQFQSPYGEMTFDKDGLLYICDNANNRLVMY
ncbi:PREDICTED: E3 ubiquitin-protein ligase TRIM71-like, partial [Amphimedon queenslandica]